MILYNILSYINWNVDPDMFTIPVINHSVRWYGVLFASGFLISQQIMYYIYKKEGRPTQEIDTLTIYMVVATILGARLGHVLFYDPIDYFQNPLKILMVWEGGLASHGGVIGILMAIYLFARKTKVNYLWVLDRVCIVASLTFCMIRVGNLMNSEMIGTPATVPWAFIFVSQDDVPRHPAQLYEAIQYFFWFAVLLRTWLVKKGKLKNGTLFGWSLIVLFIFRFVDEFFKMNQEQFEEGLLLNMGQLLSLPFILAGILILLRTRNELVNDTTNKVIVDDETLNGN